MEISITDADNVPPGCFLSLAPTGMSKRQAPLRSQQKFTWRSSGNDCAMRLDVFSMLGSIELSAQELCSSGDGSSHKSEVSIPITAPGVEMCESIENETLPVRLGLRIRNHRCGISKGPATSQTRSKLSSQYPLMEDIPQKSCTNSFQSKPVAKQQRLMELFEDVSKEMMHYQPDDPWAYVASRSPSQATILEPHDNLAEQVSNPALAIQLGQKCGRSLDQEIQLSSLSDPRPSIKKTMPAKAQCDHAVQASASLSDQTVQASTSLSDASVQCSIVLNESPLDDQSKGARVDQMVQTEACGRSDLGLSSSLSDLKPCTDVGIQEEEAHHLSISGLSTAPFSISGLSTAPSLPHYPELGPLSPVKGRHRQAISPKVRDSVFGSPTSRIEPECEPSRPSTGSLSHRPLNGNNTCSPSIREPEAEIAHILEVPSSADSQFVARGSHRSSGSKMNPAYHESGSQAQIFRRFETKFKTSHSAPSLASHSTMLGLVETRYGQTSMRPLSACSTLFGSEVDLEASFWHDDQREDCRVYGDDNEVTYTDFVGSPGRALRKTRSSMAKQSRLASGEETPIVQHDESCEDRCEVAPTPHHLLPSGGGIEASENLGEEVEARVVFDELSVSHVPQTSISDFDLSPPPSVEEELVDSVIALELVQKMQVTCERDPGRKTSKTPTLYSQESSSHFSGDLLIDRTIEASLRSVYNSCPSDGYMGDSRRQLDDTLSMRTVPSLTGSASTSSCLGNIYAPPWHSIMQHAPSEPGISRISESNTSLYNLDNHLKYGLVAVTASHSEEEIISSSISQPVAAHLSTEGCLAIAQQSATELCSSSRLKGDDECNPVEVKYLEDIDSGSCASATTLARDVVDCIMQTDLAFAACSEHRLPSKETSNVCSAICGESEQPILVKSACSPHVQNTNSNASLLAPVPAIQGVDVITRTDTIVRTDTCSTPQLCRESNTKHLESVDSASCDSATAFARDVVDCIMQSDLAFTACSDNQLESKEMSDTCPSICSDSLQHATLQNGYSLHTQKNLKDSEDHEVQSIETQNSMLRHEAPHALLEFSCDQPGRLQSKLTSDLCSAMSSDSLQHAQTRTARSWQARMDAKGLLLAALDPDKGSNVTASNVLSATSNENTERSHQSKHDIHGSAEISKVLLATSSVRLDQPQSKETSDMCSSLPIENQQASQMMANESSNLYTLGPVENSSVPLSSVPFATSSVYVKPYLRSKETSQVCSATSSDNPQYAQTIAKDRLYAGTAEGHEELGVVASTTLTQAHLLQCIMQGRLDTTDLSSRKNSKEEASEVQSATSGESARAPYVQLEASYSKRQADSFSEESLVSSPHKQSALHGTPWSADTANKELLKTFRDKEAELEVVQASITTTSAANQAYAQKNASLRGRRVILESLGESDVAIETTASESELPSEVVKLVAELDETDLSNERLKKTNDSARKELRKSLTLLSGE